MNNPTIPWHGFSPEKVLTETESRKSGLTDEEAAERLNRYGYNELTAKKKSPLILVFLRQFLSPLIYVLLAAGIISLVSQYLTGENHYLDAIVIFGVIILNAVIGTFQENQAEQAMEALLEMAAPKARVKRSGNIRIIPAREIVPGDIVLLEAGDKVPTDIRLIECSNLRVDESALTGESVPVGKRLDSIPDNAMIAERTNMLFMSTIVTGGRATGIAVLTGMNTEIGRIATGLDEVLQEETPLQKNIKQLSQYLVFIFVGVSALLVVVGLIQGLELFDLFMLAVAAAVASIPEGLPAVVTIVLAIGMRAMAKRNAIVRRLVAVETLGSATVICSDKTGTLTLNQMTVRKIYTDGEYVDISGEGYEPEGKFTRDSKTINPAENRQLTLLLRGGALCNDASLTKNNRKNGIFGDPTEGALIVAAAKAGLHKSELEKLYPREDELPFVSEKQYMVTLHDEAGQKTAYIKGAVEKILSYSSSTLKNGQIQKITKDDIEEISRAAESMAKEALRVIAVAYRSFERKPDMLTDADIQRDLVFVGLQGMADPPRQEAKEAIELCRQAGIKVKTKRGRHVSTLSQIPATPTARYGLLPLRRRLF